MSKAKLHDDFDSIPDLKDLTPWDSIHLAKNFAEHLSNFPIEQVRLESYGDRHALWFNNFAILLRVVHIPRPKYNSTNTLVHKRLIIQDGALITNGIATKEVLNANLKLKGARRAAWFRATCHDILRKMGIYYIEDVSISTLLFGQYGDRGVELTDAEWDKINDNKNVPAPLIHVPDRSVPADRRYGK